MNECNRIQFDLQGVLSAADDVTGDRTESLAWLVQPLKSFSGRTPASLVKAGKADDLLAYLESVSSGFAG
jgi:uncharacterized protein (DUF2384 family)